MYCKNCNSEIEDDEYFCGNCGINLKTLPTVTNLNSGLFPEKSLPEYAHLKSIPKINISIYFSYFSFFVGVIVVLFVSPLYGLLAGLIGIISASFISKKRHIIHKIFGLVLASLLIISAVGLISYNYSNYKKNQVSSKPISSNYLISSSVNTSCYSFNFPIQLYVSSNNGGCSIEAYNGSNLSNSTVFYKVLALNDSSLTSQNFLSLIKPIILKDVNQNLVGFTISNTKLTNFSGNLAFEVTANSNSNNSSIIEEGVYHPSTTNNFFDIIYADTHPNVNLNSLESSWIWKN